jgi:hypothetical protein
LAVNARARLTMPRRHPIALVPVILLSVAVITGCGSKGGPTDPPSTGPTERTFVGVLNVPGADSLGGLFQLTTMVSSASAPSQQRAEYAFARVFDWVVPPLWAQTGTATTGNLLTNSGKLVSLSGTYAGGSFSVIGDGYNITATVGTTGNMNGNATVPGGAPAAVNPVNTAQATAPPPGNPTGTYKGTFEMYTTLKSRNEAPDGRLIGTCNYPLRITGDLTMHVSKPGSSPDVEGHIDMNWREQSAGGSTCPPVFVHNATDYHGIDFEGTVTGLNPVRTLTMPAGPGNAGTLVRTQGFSGAVSGNTVIGTVFLTMSFKTPVPEGVHYESFAPAPKVTVTLTKN